MVDLLEGLKLTWMRNRSSKLPYHCRRLSCLPFWRTAKTIELGCMNGVVMMLSNTTFIALSWNSTLLAAPRPHGVDGMLVDASVLGAQHGAGSAFLSSRKGEGGGTLGDYNSSQLTAKRAVELILQTRSVHSVGDIPF